MIYLDFETRGVVDLTRVGQTRYAMDEWTQALCMCWAFDQEAKVDLWHREHPWIVKSKFPRELCERIASGELVEAHNAGFEFHIWNIVLRREFPEFEPYILKLEQMRCSAAKASCLSLPRALGDAVNAVNLPHKKLADGRRLINKLSKPMAARKKDKVEGAPPVWCEEEAEHRKNWVYCAQDVRAERGLSNFCPEMTPRELEYWFMDQRMNQRGITLDLPAAEVALDLASQETKRLNAELQEITNGVVPKGSQRAKLLAWVNSTLREVMPDSTGLLNTKADTLSFSLYGVPTKAGEEAKAAVKPEIDAKWVAIGIGGVPIRRVMEICMEVNRTSVSKYDQMVNSVCPDGKLHDIMLYNGADRTGRWSGKGVQPHNFVRGWKQDMSSAWEDIMSLDLELITMIWGEPMVVLAKACRGALIASSGNELYAADFNAIEARKLAWMANCVKLLTLFQTGGDPYVAMAAAIYKIPIDLTDLGAIKLFKKEHPSERNLGKKAILGLGYAMGWEKFQATVYADEGIWLDDEFCQMVVKVYRKEMYPEIPALWADTGKAAIGAVQEGGEWHVGGDELGTGGVSYFLSDDKNFLHCRLPSGRLLAYLYPEVHTRVNYRFAAINERGGSTMVMFPAKKNVPMNRVRYHAEKMAEKQHKRLLDDKPESFLSPHLSFMGRDMFTKQWKRLGTHGGTLVENYDQASSRDLLAEAMLRVDADERFGLLLSIHDEVIAEAPIGTCSLKEFETMTSEVPKWAPGMPIAAEGWIGPRLRK